ncbi:hypothetical protein G9A89_015840 [Geosiphon pyriformis]|nr:hypothetical protein G9A89_015840 [Geosiphon pyriformis]
MAQVSTLFQPAYLVQSQTHNHIKSSVTNENDPFIQSAVDLASEALDEIQISDKTCFALSSSTNGNDESALEFVYRIYNDSSAQNEDDLNILVEIKEWLDENDESAETIFQTVYQKRDDESYASFLGFLYCYGLGTPVDKEKTFYWYKVAADRGEPLGLLQLGWCYHEAFGITQNDKKAFELFEKCASTGYATGQTWLGHCYEHGHGTEIDLEKAFTWYSNSAKGDCAWGQNMLAHMYRKGIVTQRDQAQAFLWFEKSAQRGYVESQCWLASYLQTGTGTKKDLEKAFEWYSRAAPHDDYSLNMIGFCHMNGEGTQKNILRGFFYYKQAGHNGHSRGQMNLACCYHYALGTLRDLHEALRWYKIAYRNGDENTMREITAVFDQLP